MNSNAKNLTVTSLMQLRIEEQALKMGEKMFASQKRPAILQELAGTT